MVSSGRPSCSSAASPLSTTRCRRRKQQPRQSNKKKAPALQKRQQSQEPMVRQVKTMQQLRWLLIQRAKPRSPRSRGKRSSAWRRRYCSAWQSKPLRKKTDETLVKKQKLRLDISISLIARIKLNIRRETIEKFRAINSRGWPGKFALQKSLCRVERSQIHN